MSNLSKYELGDLNGRDDVAELCSGGAVCLRRCYQPGLICTQTDLREVEWELNSFQQLDGRTCVSRCHPITNETINF